MQKFNYENNDYLNKLDELPESYYSKYIKFIKVYLSSKKGNYLDIGCGNGKTLSLLINEGYINGYGCDLSKLFINEAKRRGLKNVFAYNGTDFPFKKNNFDLIGSFNVLEHVENPESFLESQVKMLRNNGHIIVACPNFRSVLFKSNHRRLKGISNKTKNLIFIFSKVLDNNSSFEMIPPIKQEKFEYDDDAIVVTNLIDLRRNLEKNKCKIIYESGFINYDKTIYKMINSIPFIKYLLPSCFIVAQKNEKRN